MIRHSMAQLPKKGILCASYGAVHLDTTTFVQGPNRSGSEIPTLNSVLSQNWQSVRLIIAIKYYLILTKYLFTFLL